MSRRMANKMRTTNECPCYLKVHFVGPRGPPSRGVPHPYPGLRAPSGASVTGTTSFGAFRNSCQLFGLFRSKRRGKPVARWDWSLGPSASLCHMTSVQHYPGPCMPMEGLHSPISLPTCLPLPASAPVTCFQRRHRLPRECPNNGDGHC